MNSYKVLVFFFLLVLGFKKTQTSYSGLCVMAVTLEGVMTTVLGAVVYNQK